MVNPINPLPSNQQLPVMPVNTFSGQRLQRDTKEPPQMTIDKKKDVPSAREEVPREEVEKAAEKLNSLIGLLDKKMKFEVHEKTNRIMVKIIDQDTGDILTEVPPKKLLDMVSSILEQVGLIIDNKV